MGRRLSYTWTFALPNQNALIFRLNPRMTGFWMTNHRPRASFTPAI
jgi:hypothetical protein